ncbi:hypothetical protein KCP74_06920 [Salmonella enterica subsp. enterica]|nr:hypothetical protein KCP74_06920 [Salmonella enterica subsp. enterica]
MPRSVTPDGQHAFSTVGPLFRTTRCRSVISFARWWRCVLCRADRRQLTAPPVSPCHFRMRSSSASTAQ